MKQKMNNRYKNRLSVFITLIFVCFSFEGFSKEHKKQKPPVNPDSAIQSTSLPPEKTESGYASSALKIGLALVPGLGVGHIAQGRWTERGWIFTLLEPVLLVAPSMAEKQEGAFLWALYFWIGLKVWQVMDVTQNEVSKVRKSSRFQVNPLFVYHPSNNHHLGFSLKYRF